MKRIIIFTTAISLLSVLSILSCKKDDNGKTDDNGKNKFPVLTTNEVTEITHNSAKSGGIITEDGGSEIIQRGVCWSTNLNPTVNDNKTSDGGGEGNFISEIKNLEPETTYYVRAYATNSAGTSYGDQVEFKTEIAGSAPETAFSASTTSGTAPLPVKFTDQSANNPTSWQWDFGDGNSSKRQNPLHTYLNPGEYTVTLTTSNEFGTDSQTKNSFITARIFVCGDETITDTDGNVYETVLIGNQCWMAENLRTTKDAAGNNISRECYDNNPEYCTFYGGLYNWNTMMNGAGGSSSNPSGVQGICPRGWHVPSDAEWSQLRNYVVSQWFPNHDVINGAGNALKSCRRVNSPLGDECNTSEHPRWDEDTLSGKNHHGFDEFGFSALPSGTRVMGFGGIGVVTSWWSSTEYGSAGARDRTLTHFWGHIHHDASLKSFSYSVRCIKD